jgi:ribonuclease R
MEATEKPRLRDVAKQISEAERRAMAAERETTDRLIASHLADRINATFAARIAGVTRSGLFVRLKETGANGFIPISTLGNEFFEHVEEVQSLVGSRSGGAFRLGDEVEVKLIEVIPSAGAMRFEMLSEPKKGHVSLMKGWRPKRMPGANRRGPPRRR